MYSSLSSLNGDQEEEEEDQGSKAIHIPIQPSGLNFYGTVSFSQGSLPNSSWLVLPATPTVHPLIPEAQIQVPNEVDYKQIIAMAHHDMRVSIENRKKEKLKPEEYERLAHYLTNCKRDIIDFNEAIAYPSVGSQPSTSSTPSTSTSAPPNIPTNMPPPNMPPRGPPPRGGPV